MFSMSGSLALEWYNSHKLFERSEGRLTPFKHKDEQLQSQLFRVFGPTLNLKSGVRPLPHHTGDYCSRWVQTLRVSSLHFLRVSIMLSSLAIESNAASMDAQMKEPWSVAGATRPNIARRSVKSHIGSKHINTHARTLLLNPSLFQKFLPLGRRPEHQQLPRHLSQFASLDLCMTIPTVAKQSTHLPSTVWHHDQVSSVISNINLMAMMPHLPFAYPVEMVHFSVWWDLQYLCAHLQLGIIQFYPIGS